MLTKLLLLLPIFLFADTGKLTKIVDGDTLYFKKNNKVTKCRVEYIDTPESRRGKKLTRDIKNCRVSEKDMLSAGKSATRAATRLVKLKNEYEYTVSGKDRYKRSICVVNLDNGSTFNDLMILNGYAVPYRQYMNRSEKKYFEDLLERAKSNRAGLWGERKDVIECLDRARR